MDLVGKIREQAGGGIFLRQLFHAPPNQVYGEVFHGTLTR